MKILVAEDDSNISMIAKITLEKIGHHQVVLASDGKIALEKTMTQEFDLILLDGMMPNMDGVSLLKTLKSQGYRVPIIFLSAKSQESDIKEVLELGAIGYIQKPFDPKTLCAQINDILKAAA